VNFVGQDLPSLGSSWSVETQFTIQHTGGWQGVGLMVWQADNNFFRSSITHSLSGGEIYIEQSKDNPTSAEGSRQQAGGNHTVLPSAGPVTIKMRYGRANGADSVSAQYRIMAPASVASADWVDFPAPSSTWLDLNPAGGPRRDSAGSRVGLYAAGNFPGTTGAHQYSGTPAKMVVDYFRVTPDQVVSCPQDDVTPPETTAALDPAAPGAGGTYDGPVAVQLSAADAGGVQATEYRVDGGTWQENANAGDQSPFATAVTVADEGAHTVSYRSRDKAGNLEVAKEVGFTIQKAPAGDVRDVFAVGATWNPDALSVPFGDTVTWHFDEPAAVFPHDVWLVPPGGDPSPAGADIAQVTGGPVFPGGNPAPFTFRKAGAWTFLCRIHSSFDSAKREWTGMVGKVDVGEGTDPGPGPGPGPGGTGDTPPPPVVTPPGPPVLNPGPTPVPPTAAKLKTLPRTTLAAFRKHGLRLASSCESGMRGKVQIQLSRREAHKLGLRRATTLASKAVKCGGNDKVTVRLKPSGRFKRALSKAHRSVVTTVNVTMGSGSTATSDTRRLVLAAPKHR
jgi:plastocyanin